ncbi:MAG: hypothetical protein ACUVT4_03845 [Actinomycetota bacterium]
METGKKRVFTRMCLIAWGIPAVLLAFTTAMELSPWKAEPAQVDRLALDLSAAGLAAAGLGAWAFFSLYLYRRLWKLFPHVGRGEKAWTYAEGVFGLQGVGTGMSSVLSVFLYLFGGGYWRAAILASLSLVLAAVETGRFPLRAAEVEDLLEDLE